MSDLPLSGSTRGTLDRMLWPTLLSGLYCPNQKQSQALSDVQSRPSRHLPEQRETDERSNNYKCVALSPFHRIASYLVGVVQTHQLQIKVLLKEVTSSALCLTGEIYNTSDRAEPLKKSNDESVCDASKSEYFYLRGH